METDSEERIKGAWTPEEDARLIKLVEQQGAKNWTMIGAGVPGRSGKSCRLRWCNQLSPAVQHVPFTPAEDSVIMAAHERYGNKWATIARLLQGRTDNAVKNHWNSTLRRLLHAPGGGASDCSSGEVFREGEQSECESGSRRKKTCRRGEEEEKMTLLSLRMPGAGDEREEEGRNGNLKGKEGGLIGVMREMIAEEVRSYMTKFGADHHLQRSENVKAESISDN